MASESTAPNSVVISQAGVTYQTAKSRRVNWMGQRLRGNIASKEATHRKGVDRGKPIEEQQRGRSNRVMLRPASEAYDKRARHLVHNGTHNRTGHGRRTHREREFIVDQGTVHSRMPLPQVDYIV